MPIMFQEQVTGLQERITALEDERNKLEQDVDRAFGLLRDAQQTVYERDEEIKRIKQEQENLAGKFASVARIAESASKSETEATRWKERATGLDLEVRGLRQDYTTRTEDLQIERMKSAEALEEITQLREQVEPLHELVAALKSRESVDRDITTQLRRLKIDSPV